MYYKVVKQFGSEKYCSLTTSSYRVIYTPGQWSQPKLGELYVFSDIEFVRDFIAFREDEVFVWECEVKNPHKGTYRCIYDNGIDIAKFWQYHLTYGYHKKMAGVPPPAGTLMASAVKLTRKIHVL